MTETPENKDGSSGNPVEPPEVDFRELAGQGREVVVNYDGKRYRLLETRNGKLILNR